MKKSLIRNDTGELNKPLFFSILLIIFIILLSFFSNTSKKKEVLGSTSNEKVLTEEDAEDETNKEIESETTKPIKIVFAGDINFDRYVRRKALEKGNYNYIFDDLRTIFSSADLAVVNSEGPITNFDSVSMGSKIGSTKNYLFTFPQESAKVLYQENIKLVNIGNNHIFNFGDEGLTQTKEFLDEASVDYFGHTTPEQSFDDEIFVKEFDGYKILFVNYNQFIETNVGDLTTNISEYKEKVDFIILYTHWGIEYQKIANKVIQDLAHKFIDAGVDLIVGSHPHVVQQSEVYKEKTIYYSLGNFIFDQYFDNDVREGLILEVKINPENSDVSFEEHHTLIEFDSSVTLQTESTN